MTERNNRPGGPAGSMTLEAALVLPLFLFFIMNILFFVEVLRFQGRLTAALQQAGDQVREYAYYTRYAVGTSEGGSGLPSGTSFVLTETFVRGKVNQLLGESYLKNSPLKGSISYLGSSVMSGNDLVELHARYRVRPFIPVIAYGTYSMEACYLGHAWVGYTPGSFQIREETAAGDDTDSVYVARTGIVYHKDPLCPYLHPDMRWVPVGQLSELRANDGSIYHPCECCHPAAEGMVLVAPDGTRYHSDPDCTAIHKEYHEETLGEAREHLRPCPRCGHGGK